MIIIAVIIPFYDVLYELFDKGCIGKDYAQFLQKVRHFIRYLGIAVLPTVPYSPCLNEVVEGYFGLTKTNNNMTAGNPGEISIRSDIEANWKISTDQNI